MQNDRRGYKVNDYKVVTDLISDRASLSALRNEDHLIVSTLARRKCADGQRKFPDFGSNAKCGEESDRCNETCLILSSRSLLTQTRRWERDCVLKRESGPRYVSRCH